MVKLRTRAPAARAVLLASAATWSFVAAGATHAATLNDAPVAAGGGTYVLEPQNAIAAAPVAAAPVSDPSIVIAPPGTSVTDRDPTNVTGIGQMIFETVLLPARNDMIAVVDVQLPRPIATIKTIGGLIGRDLAVVGDVRRAGISRQSRGTGHQ